LLLSLHHYAVVFEPIQVVLHDVLFKPFSGVIYGAGIVLNGVSPLIPDAACITIEEGRSVHKLLDELFLVY